MLRSDLIELDDFKNIKALASAIIQQALIDLRNNSTSWTEKEKIRNWLDDKTSAFETWCDVLGFCPSQIRKGIKDHVAQGKKHKTKKIGL